MAAKSEIKMVFFFVFVVASVVCDDYNATSGEDDSSEIGISRRGNHIQWDEGIPIEVPRRTDDGTMTTASNYSLVPDSVLGLNSRRIHGSHGVATIAEFPYVAAILMNDKLWCGGVIITWTKVLTAADCLKFLFETPFRNEYMRTITVRVASNNATAGGRVLKLKKLHFHPEYKPENFEYNFLVLEVHMNVTGGNPKPLIKPINLPNEDIFYVNAKNKLWFVGWGSSSADDEAGTTLLQKIWLPVYNWLECRTLYGKLRVPYNTFCAGWKNEARNVCNHDAGGPAIIHGGLGGILSFSPKKCNIPNYPAVFMTVSYPTILPWLKSHGIGTNPPFQNAHRQ